MSTKDEKIRDNLFKFLDDTESFRGVIEENILMKDMKDDLREQGIDIDGLITKIRTLIYEKGEKIRKEKIKHE